MEIMNKMVPEKKSQEFFNGRDREAQVYEHAVVEDTTACSCNCQIVLGLCIC